jgi:hypothetical protein
MTDEKISRRGVYYDLNLSPYEYKSPYGDLFKFRSAKKLEVYARDVKTEIARVEKVLKRNKLGSFLPSEIVNLIYKNVYRSFYRKIEG